MARKRQVFRSHIILLIEGRILCLLMIGIWPYVIFNIIQGQILWDIKGFASILCLIFIGASMILTIFVCEYLWQLCFGKLIITEEYIIWKCLFCKNIVLKIDDVKYCKPCTFLEENYLRMAGIYQTSYEYVLISTDPLPNKRIDKIRSKGTLIRFVLSDKLSDTLGEILPNGGTFRAIKRKRGRQKSFFKYLKELFK